MREVRPPSCGERRQAGFWAGKCYNFHMSYFVYILECADKTLYVGSTNDLAKRLHQHNNLKSGAHYTKIRRPVVLKYSEKFASYGKARAREGMIKRMTRVDKLRLIQNSK